MDIAEQLGLVNHGAETDVIVGMLDNEELALTLVQQVSDVEFYDPRRRILFVAIRKLLLGIEPLNAENVLAECRQASNELYPKKPIAVTAEFLDSLKGNPAAAVRSAVTVHRLAWLRQAGDYAQWLVKSLQLIQIPTNFTPKPKAAGNYSHQKSATAPPSTGGTRLIICGWLSKSVN
jgi:hypothetical protein